jgi:type I restriction enzyme S subunit
MPRRLPSVNPAKFSEETFELWSVPSYDIGQPEVLLGSEIGSSKKVVEKGDLLLSRIVPHIRRAWIVDPTTKNSQIGSGEWMTFRSDDFHAPYLRHILISDRFNIQLMQTVAGVGGSLLRARPESVREIEIPLPPLPEQKRIAAILDQADALRRQRQRALDQLGQLGQSIFYDMFGDRLSKNATSTFDAGIDYVSSLVLPTDSENENLLHVGPVHIEKNSGQITWENVRTAKDDGVISGKYKFESNNVIYSKIRPSLNKVAIADRGGLCSADMYAIIPRPEVMTGEFVKFLLMSKEFLSYAHTCSGRANIPKINRKALSAFPITIPNFTLQKEFSSKLRLIDSKIILSRNATEKSESLFASLQQRAFRGEL